MKYLLTETQIDKFVNRMIQETIQELRDECEDYDEIGEWFNWDDCDGIDTVEKIVLNDVENAEPSKNLDGGIYHTFIARITIYYNSIFNRYDFSDLSGVLTYRIFQKYKIRVKIKIQEEINTRQDSNPQW